VAIICGSLPLLNPLAQGIRSKVKSGASKNYSQPSTGSNLHLHSMRGDKNGFHELDSDRGASTTSKGSNAIAMASRQNSDMESNRRDLDGKSDMGSVQV
jgi:hypothetical protein